MYDRGADEIFMFRTAGQGVLIILAIIAKISASGIEGQVVIKRKLSTRTVTAAAAAYHRGTAVELKSEAIDDPLAYERAHVVVYVEGRFPSEPVTATLEQRNRRFKDDLLVVPVGSTVSFPNEDPIFHNVFSLSKPKTFDLGSYPKGQTRSVTLTVPGIVYVNCHLHPNMSAAVVVTPNRWSARADASGLFSFADVPAGKYTVVAWHKSAGFFRQTVDVHSGAPSKVSFVIPFNEDGSVALASRR